MTKRRRGGGQRRQSDARFWGLPARTVDVNGASADSEQTEVVPPAQIQPSPDPFVVVRSLGSPPLALEPAAVERHLTAVYEEVVRAATALAAANGLLALDE